MAAGVTAHLWDIRALVKVAENWEAAHLAKANAFKAA
jgi:hypothetical protein